MDAKFEIKDFVPLSQEYLQKLPEHKQKELTEIGKKIDFADMEKVNYSKIPLCRF